MLIVRHWDLSSMLLYIIIACIGLLCLYIVKKRERLTGKKHSLFSSPYVILWLIWTIMAAGRLVNSNRVGGTDAYAYALSFESIRGFSNGFTAERMYHYGKVWEWMCTAISFISGNYHFFFFIIYGFIAFSFIYFLNEFVPTNISLIPFFLITYPIITSFNTLRTSVTIGLLLLCLVCIKKGKPLWCILWGLLSVAIQSSSIIYLAFIPFYYVFRKLRFNIKSVAIFAMVAYIGGILVRHLFASSHISVAYYANYAENSYDADFFENYWKIVLGQILLIIAFIVFYKRIKTFGETGSDEDVERMNFVWLMCMFDFIMVPFCYLIWMWRGCQYFYYARLIMWGEVVSIGDRMMVTDSKWIYRVILFCVFVAWMILMVSVSAYRSGLMPYVFSPLCTLK